MNRRRCYVLGAGFSKPFGLPLARELTERVFAHCYPRNDQNLQYRRDQYEHGIQQMFPGFTFDQIDFEELLTLLEEYGKLRQACTGSPPDSGNAPTPAHLRESLLQCLVEYLHEAERQGGASLKGDVTEFIRMSAEQRARIVSFNWDLLLENACESIGLKFGYDNSADDEVRLFKPHGSINLAETDVETYESMRQSTDVHSLIREYQEGDRLVLRAAKTSVAQLRIAAFALPLIVPPRTAKVYSSPWIRRQWGLAVRAVAGADEVYVIGYSLPVSDIWPRLLLQEGAKVEAEITVIDRDSEKQAHYRRLVSPEVSQVSVRDSWLEWLQQGS